MGKCLNFVSHCRSLGAAHHWRRHADLWPRSGRGAASPTGSNEGCARAELGDIAARGPDGQDHVTRRLWVQHQSGQTQQQRLQQHERAGCRQQVTHPEPVTRSMGGIPLWHPPSVPRAHGIPAPIAREAAGAESGSELEGPIEWRQVRRRDEDFDGSRLAGHAANEAAPFEPHEHRVHRRRREVEEALQVGMARRHASPIGCNVLADVGQELPLLARRSAGGCASSFDTRSQRCRRGQSGAAGQWGDEELNRGGRRERRDMLSNVFAFFLRARRALCGSILGAVSHDAAPRIRAPRLGTRWTSHPFTFSPSYRASRRIAPWLGPSSVS